MTRTEPLSSQKGLIDRLNWKIRRGRVQEHRVSEWRRVVETEAQAGPVSWGQL